MIKKICFLVVLQFFALKNFSQVFDVDTLLFNGNTDDHINIVIMGDGFTSGEQAKFSASAKNMTNYLFNQAPWKQYKNYFNTFAINVVSKESGAPHYNTAPDCPTGGAMIPTITPDTYFGCSFDQFNIHRLVVPTKQANIFSVLSTNFPQYDQVIILANTTHYGGSGGQFATATLNASSNEIVVHEMGHSFVSLIDEYYAGDQYAREGANMTKETNPAKVKWKNWMDYKNVGIYQHCCSTTAKLWYKPHNNCKMQFLGAPFCSVCEEAIVERIHTLTKPIISYEPLAINEIKSSDRFLTFKLNEVLKPNPNTIKVEWLLDNQPITINKDSIIIDQSLLSIGMHNLSVIVHDTTSFVRINEHNKYHFHQINWSILKTTVTTNVTSNEYDLDIELFPNPSSDIITLKALSKKSIDVDILITSLQGIVIEKVATNVDLSGKMQRNIDVSTLPKGTYYIVLSSDDMKQSIPFVKM